MAYAAFRSQFYAPLHPLDAQEQVVDIPPAYLLIRNGRDVAQEHHLHKFNYNYL